VAAVGLGEESDKEQLELGHPVLAKKISTGCSAGISWVLGKILKNRKR
jgi:hypothetical protein